MGKTRHQAIDLISKQSAACYVPVRLMSRSEDIRGRDREPGTVSAAESGSSDVSASLALDMVGRAYLALALLYETAHPGEFDDVQHKIRAFVEDNFRIIQETGRGEALAAGTVEGAARLVNSVLVDVEHKIATMIRPSRHMRG
jgi:hypothetical protein